MVWRVLVTLILLTHFAFLAYVVGGGFLAWRWPKALWPHVAAVTWGVLLISLHLSCPLTAAENSARGLAGEGVDSGFVDHYVRGVIYPAHATSLARLACAVVVLISWLGVVRRYVRTGVSNTPRFGGR
jgi:Protein of Unknown function (DUF2784)